VSEALAKSLSILFVTALVVSVVGAGVAVADTKSGGNASVSDAGNAPAVYVADATIDDSTDSTIELAYNLTASDDPSQMEVTVDGPKIHGSTEYNDDLSGSVDTTEGTLTLTIPANTYGGGNQTLVARLENTTASSTDARDVGTVNVTSPIRVNATGIETAPWYVNRSVTGTATLYNPDSTAHDYTVSLYTPRDTVAWNQLSGSPATTTVEVPAGSTVNASVDTAYGNYDVGQDRTLRLNRRTTRAETVVNPANVTDSDLSNDTVVIGDSTSLTVSVTNTGDETGTYPVRVTGEHGFPEHNATSLRLAPGETKQTTLDVSFSTAGVHRLEANDETGIEVSVLNPVDVTDYSLSSTDVYVGEPVTVTATVVNTGSGGTYPVTVTRNGRAVGNTEVTLANGEQTTVSFDATFDRGTSHYDSLALNNATLEDLSVSERIVESSVTVNDGVAVGETTWVNVTYENPTSAGDSVHVPTSLGDSDWTEIRLGAGETRTVNMSGSFDEPGRHYQYLNTESVQVFVFDDTSGTANLAVVEPPLTSRAVVGERTYVPVTVGNDGDAAGAREVTLSVDGTAVDTRRVYAEPGAETYVGFPQTFEAAGTYEVSVAGQSRNVTVSDPVVVDTSIAHVGGTEPMELPTVDTGYGPYGGVSLALRTEDGRFDLSRIGADATSSFRVDATLENYDPRVLVNRGDDTSWTTTDVGSNKTRVSVVVSPSQLNYVRDAPSLDEWGDRNLTADFTADAGAFMLVGDAENDRFSYQPSTLEGLRVSTDAQRFRQPQYDPGGDDADPRIEVQVGAPHRTASGELNSGYYQAYVPDSLLSAWNVSDASELTVDYTAADTTYTVEDVQDGLRVNVSLHYSSGTVAISPSTSTSTDDSTTDDSTTTSTTTSGTTTTATPTPTPEDTTTETATRTPTSSPVPTATPTETGTPTPTDIGTPTPTATATATATASPTASATPTAGDGPGFGMAAAVLALVAGLLVRRR
jgi:hypothetical protein